MSSTARLFRPLTVIVGGAALALVGPAAAFAHVDPDPGEIPTGVPSAVSFTLEHGCEGSPTVKVELKIPEGFTDVTVPAIEGWTATDVDGVITWEGGPLDAETEGAFAVSLTATTPGEFEMPIVQTCETGSIAWIEAEVEGQPEPEHPAPVLRVTGDAVVPNAENEESATTEHDMDVTTSSVIEAATDDTAEAPHDEAAADTTTPLVIAPAPDSVPADAGDDSNTGPIVGGVVAAVVVLGGGGYALTRKRKSSPGR